VQQQPSGMFGNQTTHLTWEVPIIRIHLDRWPASSSSEGFRLW